MSYRKVNDNSLASVADAIRSKGGTSGALVFPDGFVSAISAIQTGGGAPSRQAKLTITSTDYTGNCYGIFIFVNSEGHLDTLDYMGRPFTFPITIETVLGGMVVFITSGFPGIPVSGYPIGCETYPYQRASYTLVTNLQASVDIGNAD